MDNESHITHTFERPEAFGFSRIQVKWIPIVEPPGIRRGREAIEHAAITTDFNWIYRNWPPPQAEFHPRSNKISKTSAGTFSGGVNEAWNKRTFTDMKSRAQEGKGKAVDARINLPTSFEEQPVRPKSREIGRSIGKPPRPELEPRTNKIYNTSTRSARAPSLPPPPLVN